MATVTLPARFFAGELTDQEQIVHNVPSAETHIVTSVTVQNLTDVARKVSLKLADVLLTKDLDIAPRSLVILDFKQVLNAGENIKVQGSANSALTCFVSGVKVVTTS